jgi:hypothetical protein
MPHDKSKADKPAGNQVADVEENEIDYLARKAGVPRDKAREVLKRLRKQSRDAQGPVIESINPMQRDEYAELESKIRIRAYQLWEEAGRPHGRELEHWFAAESEVAGRPATTLWRSNDPRETLPAIGSTVRDKNELARNGRNEEPKTPKTSEAADLSPNISESPSASCLQRKVNTPPGLPLSRPVSDS